MDKQTKAYVKELEQRLVTLAEELGQALAKNDALEAKLKAEPSTEIGEYKQTNAKLIKALQTIADGKGKYAKVARDALKFS